jgi:hypothetical protein
MLQLVDGTVSAGVDVLGEGKVFHKLLFVAGTPEFGNRRCSLPSGSGRLDVK